MAIEVFFAKVGELYGAEAGDIGEIPMNEPVCEETTRKLLVPGIVMRSERSDSNCAS